MIIVTGGCGFVGSHLVRGLNQRGYEDILVVDDLSDGKKFINMADCQISDYLDQADFYPLLAQAKKALPPIEAVFHQGACAVTTEWDGRFMMRNNYECSKQLFHYCTQHHIPLIYASSAAVYGRGTQFKEQLDCEAPINIYAYSKWLFDQYVRRHYKDLKSPVIGLRYFNVYGPGEQHKGAMASVVLHFYKQLMQEGEIKLFEGSDGYEKGEQCRDFIDVSDVVDINLWCFENLSRASIIGPVVNVGTGVSHTFNTVARSVLEACHSSSGQLVYIPFPAHLVGAYQSYTQADISRLRAAGYASAFTPIKVGVQRYIQTLSQTS